jgi:hypothetical protein
MTDDVVRRAQEADIVGRIAVQNPRCLRTNVCAARMSLELHRRSEARAQLERAVEIPVDAVELAEVKRLAQRLLRALSDITEEPRVDRARASPAMPVEDVEGPASRAGLIAGVALAVVIAFVLYAT